jgi:hypothetical protein
MGMRDRYAEQRGGLASPGRPERLGGLGGHSGPPMRWFDNTGSLVYKVRVLSPFPAMETYADH